MVGANLNILDQIVRFFILLSDAQSYWFSVSFLQSSARENGGALTTLKIRLRWSTMNTTIHEMMGAIGSGSGQWLLTAALAYDGEVAVVKMVSGSGGGG
jgi:predicted outer membrane repeat protein